MRNSTIALFLVSACSLGVASEPAAKVQLPCKSSYQLLSPTGTQLGVSCDDHSLQLVELRQAAQHRVLSAGQQANNDSATFSPDGRWLAVGFWDGSVEVFTTATGASVKRWKADSHRIDILSFFPDGKSLFVGPVDSPGQVWSLAETPSLRGTLPVDFGGINAVAVSPDGKTIVAAGDDTLVRWYDTGSWKRIREYRSFLLETFALAFTHDGKYVLAGGADSRITLLDADSATLVGELRPETGSYIVAIQILGDKQHAATVYLDNAGEKPAHALLWDLATAKSAAVTSDSPCTCAGIVNGKFWVCTANGNTLTVTQHE
jgi:WD40 repeat protein